ncbi:MAG: hypothetical protein WCA16_07035, partial [Candidatus Sulfotelmatobacter sp.]
MAQQNLSGSSGARGAQGVSGAPALPDYVLNPEKRLVAVKFRKKVTASDIERYAAALLVNPLFDPEFSEIVDLSDVEEIDLQADEFIRLADEVDPFSLQSRRAFVV